MARALQHVVNPGGPRPPQGPPQGHLLLPLQGRDQVAGPGRLAQHLVPEEGEGGEGAVLGLPVGRRGALRPQELPEVAQCLHLQLVHLRGPPGEGEGEDGGAEREELRRGGLGGEDGGEQGRHQV